MPDMSHPVVGSHGRRPRTCHRQVGPSGRALFITMTAGVILAALALSLAPLGWAEEPAAPPVAASILFVKGDVTMRVGGGTWQVAKAGQPLVPGTEVRVGPQSSAELAYDAAHTRVSRLDQEGVIVVDEAGSDGVRIRLKQGRLFNIVSPLQTGEHFIVQTPEAVASVRGTIFEGDHAPDTGSKFAVYNQGDNQKHEIVTQPIDAEGKPVGEEKVIGEGMQAGVQGGRLSEPEPVPPEKQAQAVELMKEVEQHSHEGAPDNNANKQTGGGGAPPPGGTPPTTPSGTSTTPSGGSSAPTLGAQGTPAPGTPGAPTSSTPPPLMTGGVFPGGSMMQAGGMPAAAPSAGSNAVGSPAMGPNPMMAGGPMPSNTPMMGFAGGTGPMGPGTSPMSGSSAAGSMIGSGGPMGPNAMMGPATNGPVQPTGPSSMPGSDMTKMRSAAEGPGAGTSRGPDNGPMGMDQQQTKALADFLGVKPETMSKMGATEVAGRMEAKAMQEMRFAYEQAMKAGNSAAMDQIQTIFHDTIAVAHAPSPTADTMMSMANGPSGMQGSGSTGSKSTGASSTTNVALMSTPITGAGTLAAPAMMSAVAMGPMGAAVMAPAMMSSAMGGAGLMNLGSGGSFGAGLTASAASGQMMSAGSMGSDTFGLGGGQGTFQLTSGGSAANLAGSYHDSLGYQNSNQNASLGTSQEFHQELQGSLATQTTANSLVAGSAGSSVLPETFDHFGLVNPQMLFLDTNHGMTHYDLGNDRAIFKRSDGLFTEHADPVLLGSTLDHFENNGHGIYREYNAYNTAQFEMVDRGVDPFDRFDRIDVKYGIFRFSDNITMRNIGRLLLDETFLGISGSRAYFTRPGGSPRDVGSVQAGEQFDHYQYLNEIHAIHELPPNLTDDHGRVQEPFDHWQQMGDGYHAIYRKDNGQENDVGTVANHPDRLPIDHYELRADGYHELRKLPDGTLQDAGVKTPP